MQDHQGEGHPGTPCNPPGVGVEQTGLAGVRAWRNKPFEGNEQSQRSHPCPSDYREKEGPAVVPVPSLRNGSPRELLAKFGGDCGKGERTRHSLVGYLLSHGLLPASGPPAVGHGGPGPGEGPLGSGF